MGNTTSSSQVARVGKLAVIQGSERTLALSLSHSVELGPSALGKFVWKLATR